MRGSFFTLVVLLWGFLSTFLLSAETKYLDNHSCKECHERIYDEYQSSSHSKSYFTNELHRKIADKVSTEKYDCATCHMPMANNISDLISGKARPNKDNKTHSDGVSCFFCHTIAYVKQSHAFNVNIKAKQAKNFKPTLYGLLDDAEDSDKHSSVKNPVYSQKACTGCHSHKLNENNVTIFRAMQPKQSGKSCIICHMPEIDGGIEKLNKKTRSHHASHKFLGIHDKEFRATGMDIEICAKVDKLLVTLTNKMEHPLIIQAARVKYLEIEIVSNGKVIWRNYKENPSEDKQGYFTSNFTKDGDNVIIPSGATKGSTNNIEAKEVKTLTYMTPNITKGDKVIITLFVQLARPECLSVIDLEDKSIIEPIVMKKVEKIVKNP